MRVQLSFILSQITRLTDRRTNRILIARPRMHSMLRGKSKSAQSVCQDTVNKRVADNRHNYLYTCIRHIIRQTALSA